MNNQKIITSLTVLAAGFVATKALDLVWKAVTGNKPPSMDDDDVPLRQIVMFAAASGAIAALARSGATRATTKYIAKRSPQQ